MFDYNLIFSFHRVNKLYMQSGAVTDREGGADLHQHWVSRSSSKSETACQVQKGKYLCRRKGVEVHTNCFLKEIFAYSAGGVQQVDVEWRWGLRITPERGQGKKWIWSWGRDMKCEPRATSQACQQSVQKTFVKAHWKWHHCQGRCFQ